MEVISGVRVDQKTSAPKVKGRSDVHKIAGKSSIRRTHKVPHPPARTLVEDKEVRITTFDVFSCFLSLCSFVKPAR